MPYDPLNETFQSYVTETCSNRNVIQFSSVYWFHAAVTWQNQRTNM